MDEQALREALRSEAADQPFAPGAVDRAVERGRSHRRRRRTTLLAVVPLVALAVAGAGAAALTWLPGDPPAARSAGHGAVARPVQLLTWPEPDGPGVAMEALYHGTLTVTDNGCVALGHIAETHPVIPVAWPPGWSVARDGDGRAALFDGTGRLRAREGDAIGLGGGNLDYDNGLMPIDPNHPCALGDTRYFFASGELSSETHP